MSSTEIESKNRRHVLALSGGKDSSALAVYMRDRVPDMEYVFCDTGKELKETYDYLDKLEVFLGKPIARIQNGSMGFDDLLRIRNGFLPSPQQRWCTEYLKIVPYERYIGEDWVTSYVGIRADEPERKGYISTKPNIKPRFPFVEDGLMRDDVIRILEDSGLGVPSYYEWRSRSGCYFCFYQQRREWVGLLETHPDLFREAMKYEKPDPVSGKRYTWIQNESLTELAKPERVAEIKAEYKKRRAREAELAGNASLGEVFGTGCEDEEMGCTVCHL
ncbi:MAG: phosphoadenosine phosphosulfate reductase family protein [Verrucomicrobia bacterium]|nr:phosphoadenosine phosphosulfate reductase family protein [Verrucomicrobiota bacterium]